MVHIRGQLSNWITSRSNPDDCTSESTIVLSGTPQGLNDLPLSIKSHCRLFAELDTDKLRQDLSSLEVWANILLLSACLDTHAP